MDAIIKNGELAPNFQLPDLHDKLYFLDEMKGWIRVLNFWSAECIWSERVDHELATWMETWKERVKVIWIASNANESRDLIKAVAKERGITFILKDADQRVANLYGVQTTPHFFVIDGEGKLTYQGAWDDITFRRRVATHVYVPEVVNTMMKGLTPAWTQTPPYGCALVRYSEAKT